MQTPLLPQRNNRSACCVSKPILWTYFGALFLICVAMNFLPLIMHTGSELPRTSGWPATLCAVTNITSAPDHWNVEVKYLNDMRSTISVCVTDDEHMGCMCPYELNHQYACVYDYEHTDTVYFEDMVQRDHEGQITIALSIFSVYTFLFVVALVTVIVAVRRRLFLLCQETYTGNPSEEAHKVPFLFRRLMGTTLMDGESVLWTERDRSFEARIIPFALMASLVSGPIALFVINRPLAPLAIPPMVFLFPMLMVWWLIPSCYILTNKRIMKAEILVTGTAVKFIEFVAITRMTPKHGVVIVGNHDFCFTLGGHENYKKIEYMILNYLHPDQISALYGEVPAYDQGMSLSCSYKSWRPPVLQSLNMSNSTIMSFGDDHVYKLTRICEELFVPMYSSEGFYPAYYEVFPAELVGLIDRKMFSDGMAELVTTKREGNVYSHNSTLNTILVIFSILTILPIAYVVYKKIKSTTKYSACLGFVNSSVFAKYNMEFLEIDAPEGVNAHIYGIAVYGRQACDYEHFV